MNVKVGQCATQHLVQILNHYSCHSQNSPNRNKNISFESLVPYFRRAFIIKFNKALSGTKMHLGACTASLYLRPYKIDCMTPSGYTYVQKSNVFTSEMASMIVFLVFKGFVMPSSQNFDTLLSRSIYILKAIQSTAFLLSSDYSNLFPLFMINFLKDFQKLLIITPGFSV